MKRFLIFSLLLEIAPVWAEEIKDVKPPVDLPPNYFWLYVLAALLGIALFFFGGRWLKKILAQRKVPVSPIVLPPWQIALDALQKLTQENLPAQGKVKEYYIRLSDVLRRYIEERFVIRAPEMTTEEFLWHLRSAQQLTPAHKEALREFLNHCDMVKFAKYTANENEMIKSMDAAKRFVDETTPAPTSIE